MSLSMLYIPDGLCQVFIRLFIPVITKTGITIGSNVWLGGNVVILPGVTIGDGCVIGAGSVVTHDIEPNSVAVGNPCHVISHIDQNETMEQAF